MPTHEQPAGDFQQHHTLHAEELAQIRGYFAVNEAGARMFGDREIIDHTTTDVEGKVDIRNWGAGGEALVVDSKKYPEGFDKLRDLYADEASEPERDFGYPVDPEWRVLRDIQRAVTKSMDYDLDAVEKIYPQSAGDGRIEKVSLGDFILEGKGVCRHMALAAAWLGGELKKKGELEGTTTAGVNQNDELGAHEWARYTTPDGRVYIIDPAQKFFGTLENAANRAYWDYFDEGERDTYMAAAKARQIAAFAPKAEAVATTSEVNPQLSEAAAAPVEADVAAASEKRMRLAVYGQRVKAVSGYYKEQSPHLKANPETFKAVDAEIRDLLRQSLGVIDDIDASSSLAISRQLEGVVEQTNDILAKQFGGLQLEEPQPAGIVRSADEQKARFRNMVAALSSRVVEPRLQRNFLALQETYARSIRDIAQAYRPSGQPAKPAQARAA
jgi:hypothetical protein